MSVRLRQKAIIHVHSDSYAVDLVLVNHALALTRETLDLSAIQAG